MEWYNNMSELQKDNFKKVIAVSILGAIVVLLISTVFHLI